MVKLAMTLKSPMHETCTVQDWMQQLAMPNALIRDLIEPLCLGAMNEATDTASALSFRRVLHESFANHKQARLGWFTKPMDKALIEPLCERAKTLGVKLHTRTRIASLQEKNNIIQIQGQSFQSAIIALPAYATDRLLGRQTTSETGAICNVHLWFEQDITLPSPFIGGLGTTGQWFFDVSLQMQQQGTLRHICAVISADKSSDRHGLNDLKLVHIILDELKAITANTTLSPVHYRIIREKRATVLVRHEHSEHDLPTSLIDASERPKPGQLPATIELAIQRGENAALSCLKRFKA